MSPREFLRTEIPKPLLARAMILIFVVLAYSCIYGVAVMTTSPRGSGETPGEAIMVRGAFFLTFGLAAAIVAFLTTILTIWQRRYLSKFWIFVGVSPTFSLIPAAAYIIFNLGDL